MSGVIDEEGNTGMFAAEEVNADQAMPGMFDAEV
jgi:hypothetical protein